MKQEAYSALHVYGDYEKAIQLISQLLENDSLNIDLLYNRGDAYKYNYNFQKALDDFKKIESLKTNISGQTVLRIGLIEKSLNKLKDAEATFKKLMIISEEKDNNNNERWAAYYHLGQIKYKQTEFRQAIGYYNEAEAIKHTLNNLYHRANAYYALGIKDSAIWDYNQSIEFVKKDFVHEYPNTILEKCDTCGFEFGTEEYVILTEPLNHTLIGLMNKLERLNK
jgi:tetratricopeptide (TPR) repeat protein